MHHQPYDVVSGDTSPKSSGIASFMRLGTPDRGEIPDIGFLGVPWDAGSSVRPGSRFGPRALRDASVVIRRYHPILRMSPFEGTRVRDLGDCDINPYDLPLTLSQVEHEVRRHTANRTSLIVGGGDHLTTLPVLRGLKDNGPFAVVHLDAHSDTEDSFFGSRYNHGTPFRRAIEEGLIDPKLLFQIGIRGALYEPTEFDFALEHGVSIIGVDEAIDRGADDVAKSIYAKIPPGHPVYVSIDIDAIDPTFAPGTGSPEIAGLTPHFCLRLLRGLAGLSVVAGDLVEVSPSYDSGTQTALIGATLLFELMCLVRIGRDPQQWSRHA
jgi:guanidinopropionase